LTVSSKNKDEGIDINIEIKAETYFKSLGKQPMAFYDALSELIDNSLSANIKSDDYFKQSNPEESFRIDVTFIQKDDTNIDCIVADSGVGMDKETLCNHVMRTGDIEKGDGILNEHGFGLKNSLCWFTENKPNSFKIISRASNMQEKTYNLVLGPFRKGMKLNIKGEEFTEIWNQGAETLQKPTIGTRVHFCTTLDKLKTAYPLGKTLRTLIDALGEHLGVIYRTYLKKSKKNKITIFWKDETRNEKGELEIKEIFPIFKDGTYLDNGIEKPCYKEDIIKISHEGKIYEINYNRGIVDWSKTYKKYNDSEVGKAVSPFKIYYRKNQKTQGAEIVYNGRTLSTKLMNEIWDSVPKNGDVRDIDRHNNYNDFVGEILINSKDFGTVNNKIGLNPSDKLWLKLKDILNKNKDFYPLLWGIKQKEKSITKKLANQLKKQPGTLSVDIEKALNHNVKADIIQIFDQGFEHIWEVKRGTAEPLDVYQCIMYWDIYKWDKDKNLQRIILIANRKSPNTQAMIDFWNTRKDKHGKNYVIDFRTLADMNLVE